MDFNAAMARAAEAEADGDDVAADNMRNAIRQQAETIKAQVAKDLGVEASAVQVGVSDKGPVSVSAPLAPAASPTAPIVDAGSSWW